MERPEARHGVPHGEDLAAELPVDLCQRGLAEAGLSTDETVVRIGKSAEVVDDHFVNLVPDLSWQGQKVGVALETVSHLKRSGLLRAPWPGSRAAGCTTFGTSSSRSSSDDKTAWLMGPSKFSSCEKLVSRWLSFREHFHRCLLSKE